MSLSYYFLVSYGWYIEMTTYLRMKFFWMSLICLGSWAISAEDVPQISDTKEYFEWFMNEGIYSTDLSDDNVRRSISIGIKSEDSYIVSSTVQALAFFAFGHEWNSYPDYESLGKPLERSSLAVPGLKEFLIEYWRTKQSSDRDHPDYPSWMFVPRALAFIFPQDTEVLDVIWEISATMNHRTFDLQLLNLGKFDSQEVNMYRIESLSLPYHSDADNHIKYAALGLAEYQSPEGLDALVQRLDVPHEDLHWVLDAISAYGIKAMPYLNQLRSLESKMDVLPYSDKFKERLNALLRNLEELEARDPA